MKSIFLVNPISGRGHLDAYARLYSRALVELGYRVVLIAESDGGTTDYLARNAPDLTYLFSFRSFEEARQWNPATQNSARSDMNPLQRARLVWKEEGTAGLLARCVTVPGRALSSLIPRSVRHQFGRAQRGIIYYALRNRLALHLGLTRHLDAGRILFQTLLGYVDKVVTMPECSAPDLVFFLYLDLMAEQHRNTEALDRAQSWPWVGILFHPRLANRQQARLEGYFRSSKARGAVFLVPSAIQTYSNAVPRLNFALVPDVADLEKPDVMPELSEEIRRRANGRTVVLQIGSIAAHKGISTLLDVIAKADPNRFFFALIGEVYWESFGAQQSRVQSFFATPPENTLVFPNYVKDERDYNGLILGCDIIYAVYTDFNSSSNSLTKASGLHRPIVVSGNSLMGDRVRAFSIGSVAPVGDHRSILSELEVIASRPSEAFGFEQYAHAHSVETLKSALAEALPLWLSTRS